MVRINEIKVPVSHAEKDIRKKIVRMLRIRPSELISFEICKESLDARKKPELFYVYSVYAALQNEAAVLKKRLRQVQPVPEKRGYCFPEPGAEKSAHRPVIAGSGPAGLFCAYMLAMHGYAPLLIERGAPADERILDVKRFWEEGILDPESNVQFGEGGAGTFSDGKLNTLVKDSAGRNQEVLRIFVENGAPKEILYQGKPHIGTDLLAEIVSNMRRKIENLGGEVRFRSKLTGIESEDGRLSGIVINNRERIPADILVLAIGHSARDTFRMLLDTGLPMEPKAFAVGVRIEHPQEMVNRSQYGEDRKDLPAADYKLTAKAGSGRGVYSFCMCPGGYVVNASSEEGMLAVNGMSYHGRKGKHANSAIVVTVEPQDFPGDGVLSGMEFQKMLEKSAFEAGNGKIPVQRFADFKDRKGEEQPGSLTPQMKGAFQYADLWEVLPEFLGQAVLEGIEAFDKKIHGFAMDDALLSAVESRTSSPVKIPRDEAFEAGIRGIYPCGEGAGYAGGIMSAAMDGLRTAEAIAVRFCPKSP